MKKTTPAAAAAKLSTYRKKRDFTLTSEPSPEVEAPRSRPGALRFMIHKHDATALHYDLRLEIAGVLASWAVPKGPSPDPSVKRLAVETEDHPLAYATFEGRIPDDAYGGGDSIIWESGSYHTVPPGQESAQRRAGRLTVEFEGQKLKGRWHLVRTRPRGGKAQWLLFKAKDAHARPGVELTEERPESVKSGRTRTRGPVRKRALGGKHPRPVTLLRRVWPPMLARLSTPAEASEAPHVFEVKYDGFRALAALSGGKLSFQSRNALDLAPRFPTLTRALGALRVREAVLDGEIVALDKRGRSRFQLLQNVDTGKDLDLRFVAFDLLWLDGEDLRGRPLEERRELLESVLGTAKLPLQLSERLELPLPRALSEARRRGWEGLIAKRRGSTYTGSRGADWLKLKVIGGQEVVLLGYLPITNGKPQIGALIVGVHGPDGYEEVGKIGTGYTTKVRTELKQLLDRDRVKTPVAVNARPWKDAVWVKPRLVANVNYTEWTEDGRLRHPVFQGLRDDKRPEDVVRERGGSRVKGAPARRAAVPAGARRAPRALSAPAGARRAPRALAARTAAAPDPSAEVPRTPGAARGGAARKPSARKTPARKTAGRKTAGRKVRARTVSAGMTRTRKTSARKPAERKVSTRKTTTRRASADAAPARRASADVASARRTSASRTPTRTTSAGGTSTNKPSASSTSTRKPSASKSPTRRASASRSPARKASAKRSTAAGRSATAKRIRSRSAAAPVEASAGARRSAPASGEATPTARRSAMASGKPTPTVRRAASARSGAPGEVGPNTDLLTHPERVLYPADGLTKADVFAHYGRVAPLLVPVLRERPLSVQQWPAGIRAPGFFRHQLSGTPAWVPTFPVQHEEKVLQHVNVQDARVLQWLANQSALTLHMWSSHRPELDSPDWVAFDLDPGEGGWESVLQVAAELRGLLESLELGSVPKTSGKRGLHVLVPLAPGHTYEQTQAFASAVMERLARKLPDVATTERSIQKRGGRLYLDAMQNARGKTMVAPYSLRAVDGAPFSAPLQWSEVNRRLSPQQFRLQTLQQRLDAVGDLFAPALKSAQRLPPTEALAGQD